MFVVGTSSDLGQSFCPRQRKVGLEWGENRFSHYDICTKGVLLPSIDNARLQVMPVGDFCFCKDTQTGLVNGKLD